jgi:hypothetical protein
MVQYNVLMYVYQTVRPPRAPPPGPPPPPRGECGTLAPTISGVGFMGDCECGTRAPTMHVPRSLSPSLSTVCANAATCPILVLHFEQYLA